VDPPPLTSNPLDARFFCHPFKSWIRPFHEKWIILIYVLYHSRLLVLTIFSPCICSRMAPYLLVNTCLKGGPLNAKSVLMLGAIRGWKNGPSKFDIKFLATLCLEGNSTDSRSPCFDRSIGPLLHMVIFGEQSSIKRY
jgi:hypothetical protein